MHFHVLNCVEEPCQSGEAICFQKGYWSYASGEIKAGYRFILRHSNGRLALLKGQACIPSIFIIIKLVSKAIAEGWANDTLL